MRTLEELTSYIEVNSLETSRYFSEEETISAIIGHNEADGALVYFFTKLFYFGALIVCIKKENLKI